MAKRSSLHKYEIGSVMATKNSSIKIVSQIRMPNGKSTQKGYEFECLQCKNKNKIAENNLTKGRGCPVCCHNPQKVVVGVNDLATTHPWMIERLVDEEDSKKYTGKSHSTVKVKCLKCHSQENMRIDSINKSQPFCKKCRDGVSFSEKIVREVLNDVCVIYETQKSFAWSCGKTYDFYIPSLKLIIETHGAQHYGDMSRHPKWKTYEEEHENDLLKFDLSVINGIEHYVVLDCRKSELDWIKNSIENSQLPTLLHFNSNDVNWKKCEEKSLNSYLYEAWAMWNDGLSVSEIAGVLKLDPTTIYKYIKQAKNLNITTYTEKGEYNGKKDKKGVFYNT